METENWVMVYSSNMLYKVEMLKLMLDDENIDSVIINNQDSSYLFGYVELYVRNEDVMKAKTIIISEEQGDE